VFRQFGDFALCGFVVAAGVAADEPKRHLRPKVGFGGNGVDAVQVSYQSPMVSMRVIKSHNFSGVALMLIDWVSRSAPS
jgi:hypothetical protein